MPEGAEQFLHVLFDAKPETDWILIWTLQEKRSRWFQDVELATQAVDSLAQTSDVYVGVGLAPRSFGPSERCKAQDVSGIVGLWLDIDVQDPVHKKTNLPPTIEDGVAFISSVGLRPSLIVHSGHGLQAWWLFREPWIFDGELERKRAEKLAQQWTATFRLKAKERQWDVDSLHDLARVLRIPGTYNHKNGASVPTRLIVSDGTATYDPSDFDFYLIDEKYLAPEPVRGDDIGPLQINPVAAPPFDKFGLLYEIEPKFRLSWTHQRADLQDQSCSGYDMSLATYAAMVDWTDQEIADLLIAHRRRWDLAWKPRQGYLQRTIAQGRATAQKRRENDTPLDVEVHVPTVSSNGVVHTEDARASETEGAEGESDDTPEDDRSVVVVALRPHSVEHDFLSASLGVQITRLVKFRTEPATFQIVTDCGEVIIGHVEKLVDQRSFRAKFAEATGVLIQRYNNSQWDRIASALLKIVTEEDVGEEATIVGQLRTWLNDYLFQTEVLSLKARQVCEATQPFMREGFTFVFASDFKRWIRLQVFEKITMSELGIAFRGMGCQEDVIAFRNGNRSTTRRVWRLPVGFIQETTTEKKGSEATMVESGVSS